jgi:hypothetical protein
MACEPSLSLLLSFSTLTLNGFQVVFQALMLFSSSLAVSTQGWHGISLRDFLLRFYSRRFLRIILALTACLVITALLSALFMPTAYLSNTNSLTELFAFFGASNFILTDTVGDYFSPITEFNPSAGLGSSDRFSRSISGKRCLLG